MTAETHSRLIDIDWQPSDRKCRQFAAGLVVVLMLGIWLSILPGAVLYTVPIIVAISWLLPRALVPLYIAVTVVTLPIGMVLGEVALIAIYFVVFVPIGCLFRLMKRDALQRTIDRSRLSYWEECAPEREKRDYLRRY